MIAAGLRLLNALPRPWTSATFGHVLRSVTAAALALWLGFELHLDSPFSGASTVLMLVHPIQGVVVGKGANRALGTLAGVIATLVLTALFAQQMLLFILGIGLWLGLCVAAMTVLRHFQATAAVVAGYTVCLALGPALVDPLQGFDHVITRGTAVALGVLSLSLVATLFTPKTLEQKVRAALVDVSSRGVGVLARRCLDAPSAEVDSEARQLAIDIGKVDDVLGMGRGESALVRSRLATIASGLACLHSALLDVRLSPQDDLHHSRWITETGARLQDLSGRIADQRCRFPDASAEVETLRSDVAIPLNDASLHRASATLARLDEQLEALAQALVRLASVDGTAPMSVPAAGWHRDYAQAARNGVRALIATLAAGAVWFLGGWDQGPTLLAIVCPYCTVMVTVPDPVRGMSGIIRGTLYAVLAAAFCKFGLMPQFNSFGLLVAALAVFWSFGIHATTQPRQVMEGVAYLIAFNTLVSTGGGAPQYNFADFANQALAWIVALIICLLAFQMLPNDPLRRKRALRQSMEAELRRLLHRTRLLERQPWKAEQHYRAIILKGLQGSDDHDAHRIAYSSLQLEKEFIRLQSAMSRLEPDSPVTLCVRRGVMRVSRCGHDPRLCAAQARRTSRALKRCNAYRLAACFEDIAWLLDNALDH